MRKFLLILLAALSFCDASSKGNTSGAVAAENKDVFILSILVRTLLKQTKEEAVQLSKLNRQDTMQRTTENLLSVLVRQDPLQRIKNNFAQLELVQKWGYISVRYKLSEVRNRNIVLDSEEQAQMNSIRWTSRYSNSRYDGEIRFEYGERHYHIRNVIVRR